ncbi:cold-shock protein [Nocardia salmonicida]|uniref:cold-shock protein n=1 Tax=Nocardia salmonicida TaxID=53431 RepID=UPI00362B9FEE
MAARPGRLFDAKKGFGCLIPDQGGSAVFCDYTAIEAPGYKTLHAGQRVVFAVADTDRGPEALRIPTYGQPVTDIDAASRTPLPRTRARSLSGSRGTRCRRAMANLPRSRLLRGRSVPTEHATDPRAWAAGTRLPGRPHRRL